jgi:hypothetical protein
MRGLRLTNPPYELFRRHLVAGRATDFSAGFDFESLVRLRLIDTDPTGSLLGFRY